MSGNATMQVASPGDIPVTLTYTLTLDEWVDLASKLTAMTGASQVGLVVAINTIVASVRTKFSSP
jgi:hypothetical protein